MERGLPTVQNPKRGVSRSARYRGETSTQGCLNEDRIKDLVGGEPKDPRERQGRDGCVVLLGRSHQGRPEAQDTRTMISHGVEISIAGGGADEKDEENRGQSPLIYQDILAQPLPPDSYPIMSRIFA